MGKFVNDLNMDEMLNRIKNNAAKIVLCNGQPATFNEAQTNVGSTVAGGGTARRLGEIAGLSSTKFTGPADGDASGRKLSKDQETGLNIDVTSTAADHVALVITTTSSTIGNELALVTTITAPQSVTAGNTATLNAFDLEVADPT